MKTSDGISKEQYEELGRKIQNLLNEYANTLQHDDELLQYLYDNSLPELSNDKRIYYLLMNRVKNWVAKEQAKQDGGSSWKKSFRQTPEGCCLICGNQFEKDDHIEFHHVCRDGRKPLPVHKKCHDSLNKQQKNERNEKSCLT